MRTKKEGDRFPRGNDLRKQSIRRNRDWEKKKHRIDELRG